MTSKRTTSTKVIKKGSASKSKKQKGTLGADDKERAMRSLMVLKGRVKTFQKQKSFNDLESIQLENDIKDIQERIRRLTIECESESKYDTN